ncbi:MAG: ABC transporter permease [Lactimicrobium massiliense]|nr:ABC transporter permease [Lactimicrobium massiliense]MDD6559523.1 ABC transporter permease [Lactimicrobium massiliense]
MKGIGKLTRRSILSFPGRWLALVLIVMLGAGFFSGLRITRHAMGTLAQNYFSQQNLYDYRLYSSLGFTDKEVSALADLDGIGQAEGQKSLASMGSFSGRRDVYTVFALPEKINVPVLTAGRMPADSSECLGDDNFFDKQDLGKTVTLETDDLKRKEYTISGLCSSPLYIGSDRGTASIGTGSVQAFVYVMDDVFGNVCTEVDLTLLEKADAYSQAYDDLVSEFQDEVEKKCVQVSDERYHTLLADHFLTEWSGEVAGIISPKTYVLTRKDNAGYVSFQNDASIVSGIASLFPVFFVLIAMLVCVTTMTRMVEEERGMIGTLKALGFSDGAITAKYLLYAGSASLLGWIIGFFGGTWALPQIFWKAYQVSYHFARMPYVFSGSLAGGTLAVTMAGMLACTWYSCHHELKSTPAALIRPLPARHGRHLFLERFSFWQHLSFLQKISLRNAFRYPQRLVMFVTGIACCTGLLVTGFGVRDSMIGISSLQFDSIQTYDMALSFSSGKQDQVESGLQQKEHINGMLAGRETIVTAGSDVQMNGVHLYQFADGDDFGSYWHLMQDGKPVSYPPKEEAVISSSISRRLHLQKGDALVMTDSDHNRLTVKVAGVFDSYIGSFVIMNSDAVMDGSTWQTNIFLLKCSDSSDDFAKELTSISGVTGLERLQQTRQTVDRALSCLHYIIALIVLLSGALAFVVICNLTSINIAERSREIATVEVLGFYHGETYSYVLRENIILSVLAGLLGLPAGTLFVHAVMARIVVDAMSFDVHVSLRSYMLSFAVTMLFAMVVNVLMRRVIRRINMAESLKAVE